MSRINTIQLFGRLVSDIWFIWQGRADTGRSVSWAQYRISLANYASPNIGSPLPNKSDIGQAADQTTVLLFSPRILILLVIKGNYYKS